MSLARAVARQVPPAVRAKGTDYFLRGAVVHAEGSPVSVDAIVRGTRPYRVKLRRDKSKIVASCECKYFVDRIGVCKHIWAILLHAEQHGYLRAAAEDVTALRLTPDRSAAGATSTSDAHSPEWERFFHEVSQKLARDEADARPPRFHDAEIIYAIDRAASLAGQAVALDLMSRQRRSTGKWGRPKPAGVATRDVAQLPDPLDREIVPLLLGASDVYGLRVCRRSRPRLVPARRTARRSRAAAHRAVRPRRPPHPASAQRRSSIPLTWDDGPPWIFRLEVGHVSRDESVSIDGALVRGADRLLIREPTMVLPSGYLVHARPPRAARRARRVHAAAQLRGTGPLTIPPGATGQLRRRPGAVRRRSVGPARGAAVRDRRPFADADCVRSAPTIAAASPSLLATVVVRLRAVSPWIPAPERRASIANAAG